MKRLLLLVLFLVCFMGHTHAQSWSGLLNPVSGVGACTPANISSAQKCASSNWSSAGVTGGIPSASWTQSGSTITATSGDRTSTIQTALNGCGTNHFVLLGPGTFNVTNLSGKSNCVLRGSGTLQTIINASGSSGSVIQMGSGGPNYSSPASTNILSGATPGSNNIVVASASGISTGTLMAVSEINDPVYVTPIGTDGNCTWCDGTGDGGVRTRGQIVQVTGVSGTTVTFTPALYTNYGSATGTGPAVVYPFSVSVQNSGVELLQVFANGTGYSQTWGMTACANCWIKGVFDNYADGDHASIFWSYHVEIRDSYFSNAYDHSPGTFDADINIGFKTSESLLENNIFERLHVGNFTRWGAAGNVIGYNYEIGNFDASATSVILSSLIDHGAHPQFNLYEGNEGNNLTKDPFWGTSSNTTIFRNHFRGADTLASPLTTGRHVVSWASPTITTQQLMGEQLSYLHTNINSIGNVLGSQDAASVATTRYNGGSAPFTSTIVPPATRTYDKFFSAVSIGYATGSDSSGSGVPGYWVGKALGTFFQHGNFDIASASVIWNGAVTHTLPASFYKTAKPSWFGSVPWPAIGPDVTGGNVDSILLVGHVYAIPAKKCYDATSRDANGLKLFDPVACYSSTPSGPTITTASLPGATQTGTYSATVSATGGTAPYAWSIVAGTPPAGLSLNASTGVISGTNSGSAGTYNFTVQVTDNAALSATQPLSIVVAAAPTVSTSSPLPAANKNVSYSTTLAATPGTLPFTWSVTVGTLPAGLSLATATGNISGTPTVAGTSTFTAQVSDVNSVTGTKSFSLIVNAPPVITTTTLPQATQGTAYSTTVSATGGTLPYAWSISAGTIPTGLSINSSTGVISGTPSAAGTYNFTVQVTDANTFSSTQPLSIIVNLPPQVTVVTTALANGTVNVAYTAQLTASNGTTPYTWSVSVGSLPAGLSLDSTTGYINGTPTTSGVSSFTVKVVDANSTFDSKPLSITIPIPNTTVGAPSGILP